MLVPVLATLLVLRLGHGRFAPEGGAAEAPLPAASPAEIAPPSFGLLLAQVLVVLVTTRACGMALRPLGQPQVEGRPPLAA